MSNSQQQQQIFSLIQKRDAALDKRLQQKYQKRSETLVERLFSKLSECVNSGKSKQECESKYLNEEPGLIKVVDRHNECMQKVFPPNEGTIKGINKCYDEYETQMDKHMGESLNVLENLLR